MIKRHKLKQLFKKIVDFVRAVSGDDAYERYLVHWHKQHAREGEQPLNRAAFFKAEQARKWNGVKRCC
jgi:uncharacterized short protein YbdD (DUF466 family)